MMILEVITLPSVCVPRDRNGRDQSWSVETQTRELERINGFKYDN